VTAQLHFETVVPTATPKAWLLVTHGIYGSGGNWRSIARKLVDRRPGWGAVLVDLRGHGRSPSGDPPHTVEACARDLRALDERLAAEGRPARVALGHSFGGKVVLALRRLTAHGAGTSASPMDLLQTWVLDATPSARPEALHAPDNDVRRILELLERQPARLARREELIDAVIAAGHAPEVGQWLAMNLEPTDGGFRFRFDLAVIRGLLEDYYKVDLWKAVEDASMPGELHVVIAGRAATVSHDDRVRLAAHQQHTGLTSVHLVPEAGHWLHIDAPDQVVELLAGALPEL
jgi:pimeloyl-ACP methyl ester carboxylesterase